MFLRRAAAALAACALAAAPARGQDPVRSPQLLKTQRVTQPPNWKCGVDELMRRNHAIDGLVCDTHFTTAAIRAAVQEHSVSGASETCALSVAANLERSLAATMGGDTAAARRSEATKCETGIFTRDSLAYDDRVLMRLCPGVIWSWTNRGTVSCSALRIGLDSAATRASGFPRATSPGYGGRNPVRAMRQQQSESAKLAASAMDAYGGADYEKAERQSRAAVALDSTNADALAALGAVTDVFGRYREAADLLRRAVLLRPDDVWARQQLSTALFDDHRYEEAAEAARAAIAVSGESGASYLLLGQALLKLGRSADALAALSTAVGLSPKIAQAHATLADALNGAQRFAEAERSARDAIALRDRYARAWTALGVALEGEGHADQAIPAYRRALELADWDSFVRGRLKALERH
ncbi:MAG: tetratricopeptide repeat protein [Gemmatimonadota bacterium]|nr:tetratricopeptide repeat protein [Gemmatimonadota bacterium]